MRSLHDDEIDRLRLAVAATGAGIWDYDIDADQLYCDDRWHEILGLDPDRPVRSIEEFKPHIHPEDRERATEVRAPFAELTANGEDYRIIYRIIRADGAVRWVRSAACLIAAGPTSANRAVGAIVDVTEQVTAEAALAESEQLFKALADTVPQIVFSSRPDGTNDYLNMRWREFTGAVGATGDASWLGFLHPDDREGAIEAWRRAVETGEAYKTEFRYRHRSGEYRWMAAEAAPLRDDEGNILRWFGSNTDIHAAKQLQAERELVARELDHRLKNIFALVGALISLSVRDEPEMKPYAERLRHRLAALVTAHDLIGQGEGRGLTLQTLLRTLLEPYENRANPRVVVTGADQEIDTGAITSLALLFHELATNAAKYGALRTRAGTLRISIGRTADEILIDWIEQLAQAAPAPPGSSGFGSKLFALVVERQLGGRFTSDMSADGVHACIALPLASLEPRTRS